MANKLMLFTIYTRSDPSFEPIQTGQFGWANGEELVHIGYGEASFFSRCPEQ